MRRGAEGQTDQGSCLFEPQASLHETPAGPSTAGCPAAKRRGRRHQGRLLFAYFLLAKQEKVSRPPRRQSGIGLTREPRAQFNARLRQAQPERGGERARNSEAGVFGVRAQIPRAFGSPCGCCASLRATCGARFKRGHAQPRLRLKQVRARIRLKLRSSAHSQGVGPSSDSDSGSIEPASQVQ